MKIWRVTVSYLPNKTDNRGHGGVHNPDRFRKDGCRTVEIEAPDIHKAIQKAVIDVLINPLIPGGAEILGIHADWI